MQFEYDIFLSFKTSNEEVKSWVESFKAHLSIVLSQLFDKEIKIVSSNDLKQSSEVMMTTGAFVTILTNDYLNDSVEVSYLNEFNKLSKGKRIFKVVKNEIPLDDQSEILRQLNSYDFFDADSANNQKINQDRFFKTEAERLYWLKIVDLAYAIYNATVPEESENRIKNLSKSVFVAEVSEDQKKFRDTIIRELAYHGYNVLPHKALPTNKIDFQQVVSECIESSQLSIHIMGEQYGNTVVGEEISIVESQNKIASEINKKTGVERLIWVSPELKDFEERQQVYLDLLKKNIDEMEGAEMVQTPLEIFKTIITNRLSGKQKRRIGGDKSKSNAKSIYLINGKEDFDNVKNLEAWITGNGYEVIKSDFDGNRGDIVEKHRNNLVQCDGAIVYYAHSNPQWVRMKMQDLVKAPGFGRDKPMDFTAIYSTIEEELPQNTTLTNFLSIRQEGKDLNKDGLKEITIKLS